MVKGQSIDLQGPIEQQLQMSEDGGIADNQSSACNACRFLDIFCGGASRKSYHWDMAGVPVLFQFRDGIADLLGPGIKVGHDEQRLLAFGGFDEQTRIGKGMDAVAQILEAVG